MDGRQTERHIERQREWVTERDVGQKKEQAELQRDIDQQDEYQYHRRRKKKQRSPSDSDWATENVRKWTLWREPATQISNRAWIMKYSGGFSDSNDATWEVARNAEGAMESPRGRCVQEKQDGEGMSTHWQRVRQRVCFHSWGLLALGGFETDYTGEVDGSAC